MNNKGFTLVELLVVIAIIGILAIVAVPALFDNINKAKRSKVESDYNAVKSALLSYYAENNELAKNINDLQVDGMLDYKKAPIGGEYKIRAKDENNQIGSLDEDNGEPKFIPSIAHKIDKDKNLSNETISLHDYGDAYLTLQGFADNKLFISDKQFKKLVDDIGYENIFISAKPSGTGYQTGEIYIRLANNILPKPGN